MPATAPRPPTSGEFRYVRLETNWRVHQLGDDDKHTRCGLPFTARDTAGRAGVAYLCGSCFPVR